MTAWPATSVTERVARYPTAEGRPPALITENGGSLTHALV